ncbi:hypothetical protein L9F63_016390, partial [Diploptera punctata]
IQLYGFNAELYHNMSEAQHKSQGIVGISLMVQPYAMSVQEVYDWRKKILAGRDSVEDEPHQRRQRRSITADNIRAVRDLIEEDRRVVQICHPDGIKKLPTRWKKYISSPIGKEAGKFGPTKKR